jgi:hypothetical protein
MLHRWASLPDLLRLELVSHFVGIFHKELENLRFFDALCVENNRENGGIRSRSRLG